MTGNGKPSTRLIDFDAFRAERAHSEPVAILVGGFEYQLPADLPATVALEALRLQEGLQADGDTQASVLVSATQRIAEGLFGPDQLRLMLDQTGLSLMELSELIGQVLSAYGSAIVPPPNRATRRATASSGSASSSAGRS